MSGQDNIDLYNMIYICDPLEEKRLRIRLITETLKEIEGFETINRETVHLVFKKSK